MAYLFDTNVFIRLAGRNDPLRQVSVDALRKLRSRNEVLCFTPQVMSEFWNVCTRPVAARGGLGLSLAQTNRKARLIERHFVLLPDSLASFQEYSPIVASAASHRKVASSRHHAKQYVGSSAGSRHYQSHLGK